MFANSMACTPSGVTAVFVFLRGLLMILLRWMGRVRVIGVSVCVVRVIPIQIIRGRVRTARRILLAVLGRILGRGIRPIGIVLVGRAI
jgi:hypothetical protein